MRTKLCLFLLMLFVCFSNGRCAQVKQGFIPEWAKDVVWYQIFPERFRNGDENNEPTIEQVKGAYPHDGISPWQLHPWGSDWYELKPYEKENGKNIWYNLQRRRYGGDLQGILDKLDYIQDLGVTAIYLNPVFESPSLHKYDAIRYEHIDPNFGPDPVGDRKLIATEDPSNPETWHWTAADKLALKLISECHKRGIRIIFDGVFNHIGMRNPMFEDLVANQQKSKYKDWFIVKSWKDEAKGIPFEYKSWYGFKELPEWNRTEKNGLAAGPKSYIFNITKRWMDPEGNGNFTAGIDGWRLDVAFCVPHSFWKQWSKYVKSINPDAYMTAEIMDTPKANKPYLLGDEFTAVMNYNFAFYLHEFFLGIDGKKISASKFDEKMRILRQSFHPEFTYDLQNLLDSHDTARVATHILNAQHLNYGNWQAYCEIFQAEKGRLNTTKPSKEVYELQKLIALVQMTCPGAPMIYYGDEVGMWGANDPCCRKPMLWSDIKYDDEVYLSNGKKKAAATVEPNLELLAYYKKLIAMRNSSIALRRGSFNSILVDDGLSLYGYERKYGIQRVIVVVNNGDKDTTVGFKAQNGEFAIDRLHDNSKFNSVDGKISFLLPAKSGKILFMGRDEFAQELK